ncbi:MAG: hypothetical protein QM752_01775 [Gammaproteobacteria bacterium]
MQATILHTTDESKPMQRASAPPVANIPFVFCYFLNKKGIMLQVLGFSDDELATAYIPKYQKSLKPLLKNFIASLKQVQANIYHQDWGLFEATQESNYIIIQNFSVFLTHHTVELTSSYDNKNQNRKCLALYSNLYMQQLSPQAVDHLLERAKNHRISRIMPQSFTVRNAIDLLMSYEYKARIKLKLDRWIQLALIKSNPLRSFQQLCATITSAPILQSHASQTTFFKQNNLTKDKKNKKRHSLDESRDSRLTF